MLIVLIFLVRAGLVFIGFFSNWSVVPYFDLVYYMCCEILPIFIMFFILLWRTSAPPQSQHLQYQQQQQQQQQQQGGPFGGGRKSSSSDTYSGSMSDERSPLVKPAFNN